MAILSAQQALQEVIRHQREGKLTEAEALCRQVLTHQSPHDPAVHHLLGLLHYQMGRHDSAVELIQKAIALNPREPEYQSNLGAVLLAAARPREAAAACEKALALRPIYPEANNNLGNAFATLGRLDDAVAAYRRAIAQRPGVAEAYNNLGNVLRQSGKPDEAIASYREALKLRSNYPEPLYNLGMAMLESDRFDEAIDSLQQVLSMQPNNPDAQSALASALLAAKKFDEAIAIYRQALALRPAQAEMHINLGSALLIKGDCEKAMACYRDALTVQPSYAPAHNNMGLAYYKNGQVDEAIGCYERALASRPNYPEALTHLGIALQESGRLDEAVEMQRQAIAVRPDYPEAHLSLAHLLLAQGQFHEGWREYEWRRRMKFTQKPRTDLHAPQWQGEPLTGKRILIHAEQGIGDMIQFVRYVPMLAERGAKVILECYPEVRRLFAAIPGVEHFVNAGDPLPKFDLHCPMPSLPLAFGTKLETIPGQTPYLRTDPEERTRWRSRITTSGARLSVGIAWAGAPSHRNDRQRSIPLSSLARLGEVPGVRFFSLQKGEAAKQAMDRAPGLKVMSWSNKLNDFADTAALIAGLDLVITVDTAIAHLAGAMHRPVWVLLASPPDFRWLLDRDDSPWYPTMRLFRQAHPRHWNEPLNEIVVELQKLVKR